MEQNNSENQKTSPELSTASKDESIEETILRAESLLDNREVEVSEDGQIGEVSEQPSQQQAAEAPSQQSSEDDDDGEDFDLPSSYKKETRELFKKLPKGYEEIGKAFAKRAREIEKQRARTDSEYQSKTAFARKIAESVNPYLDNWTARGITPEVGIARAAKLDQLIQQDPEAAVKFIMQIAGVRQANLQDDEIERIEQSRGQKALTQSANLTQDDIRRISQEEFARASQYNAATQSNMQVLEGMINNKTPSGKDRFPNLKDEEFVAGLTPVVEVLIAQKGLSFEKAVLAAYHANGGQVVSEGERQLQQSQSQQRDNQKVERLKVASSIRPANSSSNNMNMDDIKIPDSIEETILLAERLANGRS